MEASLNCLRMVCVTMLLLCLFCCADPTDEDITPSEEENEEQHEEFTPEDADALLEAFSFTTATKVSGSVPAVANTSLIKTEDKDTLYVISGTKNLIRISHPASRLLSGIFVAVQGSTFYYEAPIDDEEDSDTVSVVLFEITPEDVDGAEHVPVEITAYDENKQPIDIIERIITVEEPNAAPVCDIREPGDTTRIETLTGGWRWKWTVLLDHNDQPIFINAPTRSFYSEQTYSGCCDGSACPALVFDPNTHVSKWVYDSEFTEKMRYSIVREYFNFFINGTFHRFTHESQSAVDAEATDWCNGVPAMKTYLDDVYYYGTHDYVPGNTRISYSTTHSHCTDPLGLCGYGSRGGELTATCHSLMITAGAEGQKEIRLYTRVYGTFSVVDEGRTLVWHE